jgi:hypothetical protein
MTPREFRNTQIMKNILITGFYYLKHPRHKILEAHFPKHSKCRGLTTVSIINQSQ